MMRYALIFPGQGAQKPGMGRELYDKYDVSRAVFQEADDALGFSLSEVIFNGSAEELTKTAITQPAIMTVSIAALRALESEYGELTPYCAAGHSLGEYTALVAAGSISLRDAVRLVHLRGSLMQDAVPIGLGAMAAIIGKDLDEVRELCSWASEGEVCQAANVNAPTQVVVSGHKGAVDRVVKMVEAEGTAKAILLKVSAPFHCDLMRPVGDKLKAAFDKISWNDPKYPIVTNAFATFVRHVPEIKEALYMQTFSPVLWSQSVIAMDESGVEGYIELGPGNVLSGLVRKICKGRKSCPVCNAEELEAAVRFLRGEEK